MSAELDNLIKAIKSAKIPGENTAARVGNTLELLNSEKSNKTENFTKSQTLDLINQVKILAATDTEFIGSITPASVIPTGDVWAFADEGTYPNANGYIVAPGEVSIITRVEGIWGKSDVKIPKEGDFVMNTPDAISFDLIGDVWHLNILTGAIRFGNKAIALNNGVQQDIIILNNDFKFIYGNITTTLIEIFDFVQNDPNLIYFGSAFPFYNIFAMRSAFLVNGKPQNIELPKIKPDDYIVTKPEWFNIVNTNNVWKIDFLNGTVAFPRDGVTSNNDGNQTVILDAPVYNFLYINTFTRLFEKFDDQQLDNTNLILIAVLAPAFNIFYCRCPFAVNGKPENMSFPVSSNAFNPAIDVPLVTNTIAFKDNESTSFYKNSIFKSLDGGNKSNLILETILNGKFMRYEIHNPTYLKASDIGTENRYVIEGNGYVDKLWKNITQIYKSVTTGLSGTTKKGMGIGDSLYQGNLNTNVAVLALLKDAFATYGITLQTIGTFNQDDGRGFRNDIISEGRGFWGLKTFTGKDNYPYSDGEGTPVVIATGNGLTQKFQNPFLRLATQTDKTNNPTWCFTNKPTNASDPDGVSFASNPNHSNYYIFDFANYMTVRNLEVPDFITISLGINDWQENPGIINISDELVCFQIMYQQIRVALPNVPIIVTPTNGIMPANQEAWENEMFPLAERIVKQLETYQLTDSNLHICPIYTHVARQNAGCLDINLSDLSANNNMIKSTTSDVHVLDKESSRQEYMQVLESVVLAVLN